MAVIPKGSTSLFWNAVETGARAAARDLGVDIIWKGPIKENDTADQMQLVEQFATESVSGILLSPLDDRALRGPVQAAMHKQIPVVIMDSPLDGQAPADFISHVGTDNRSVGELAACQLAALLNGHGNVVMLRFLDRSRSTLDREAGFMEEMKKHPGVTILVSDRFGGPGNADAQKAAAELLDTTDRIDGVFCSNEPTVTGMLLALRAANMAGSVKFVGVDSSAVMLDGLRNGEINALILQDPPRIGYDGVKTLVAHIRGEKVPGYIDTGSVLITPENLDDPKIKKLLGTKAP